ncbi:galactosylceramide sulfotransferase-like isoform X2 [Artemia franciscana]|uniref:galactosylceramide sulfotransferase-like isoform X2 n=1 Tax=Artemia franciscana TaxID=6661 RepID=UPI0032DB60FC
MNCFVSSQFIYQCSLNFKEVRMLRLFQFFFLFSYVSRILLISYFYGYFLDMESESIAFPTNYLPLNQTISKFDILIEDRRWKFEDVERVLGDNSVYVTILRSPAHQFESMFHYMDMRKFYNVSSFETFLQELELGNIKNDRFHDIFEAGRNQLSFSLGLENGDFANETAIDSFIEEIDNKFHLVMISEYFDESVILLKNLLGTAIGQMLYVKQLPRSEETKYKLTEQNTKLLEKWLSADVKLYNFFKRKLVKSLTKNIREEVRVYRKLNTELQKFCKVYQHVTGDPDPSKQFGIFELDLIRSNRHGLLCDLYFGDLLGTSRRVQKAMQYAGEVQRLF